MNDGIDTLRDNNDIAPFKNILNEMYSKMCIRDSSYTEYAGQAVIFTLSLADGSQVEIIAYLSLIHI